MFLNQYYTVTIERSNGAPSILVAVKRGDKLLETLNSDDTMAKVMDGCDGYKVTSFAYRDGSEIIDQDIVLMEAGSVKQHLPALFHVMGLKCAKHDFFRNPRITQDTSQNS